MKLNKVYFTGVGNPFGFIFTRLRREIVSTSESFYVPNNKPIETTIENFQ
jgi:hypothetical protein